MVDEGVPVVLQSEQFCISVSLPEGDGLGGGGVDCPLQELLGELIGMGTPSVARQNVQCGSGDGPTVHPRHIALPVPMFPDRAPLIIPDHFPMC